MGTTSPSAVLFGRTYRALLTIFFIRPERTFYLRQIIRIAGVGQGAVQCELGRWEKAGLLLRTQQCNQVHYQANQILPIFSELRAIMVKTSGVADVLREALVRLSENIFDPRPMSMNV